MRLPGWWEARQGREKLVLVLGVLSVLLTGLFLLLEPLYEEHQYRSGEIPHLSADLVWMQAQIASLQVDGNAPLKKQVAGVSVARVEELIKVNKMSQYLSMMKRVNGGGVKLSFDKVPYTQFIAFIYSARAEFGPVIRKVYLEPLQDEPNMISVNMELATVRQG